MRQVREIIRLKLSAGIPIESAFITSIPWQYLEFMKSALISNRII